MNQYFHGFITAICLSVSFVMFTASQKSNLGDITVNSIRVVAVSYTHLTLPTNREV